MKLTRTFYEHLASCNTLISQKEKEGYVLKGHTVNHNDDLALATVDYTFTKRKGKKS